MTQTTEPGATSTAARWSAGLDPTLIAATWVVFLLALPFLEGERPDMSRFK
jgi:hypothetical protein